MCMYVGMYISTYIFIYWYTTFKRFFSWNIALVNWPSLWIQVLESHWGFGSWDQDFQETPNYMYSIYIYILKILKSKSIGFEKHQYRCTQRLLVKETVTVGNCVEVGRSGIFCPGGVSCRAFHPSQFALIFSWWNYRNFCFILLMEEIPAPVLQNPSNSVRFSISTAARQISEASTACMTLEGAPNLK